MSPEVGPQAGVRRRSQIMGSLGGSSSGGSSGPIASNHEEDGRRSWGAPPSDKRPELNGGLIGDGGPTTLNNSGGLGVLGMRSGCDNDLGGVANEARHLNQRRQELPNAGLLLDKKRSKRRGEEIGARQEEVFGSSWLHQQRGQLATSEEIKIPALNERSSDIADNNNNNNNRKLEENQLSCLLSDNRRRTRSRRFNSLVVFGGQQTTKTREGLLGGNFSVDHSLESQVAQVEGESRCKQVVSPRKYPVSSVECEILRSNNKTSPLLRKDRERSSSVTSDYYSSNQSSPQIVRLLTSTASGQKVSSTSDHHQVASGATGTWRKLESASTKIKTTIYENPAFVGRDGDAKQHHQTCPAQSDDKKMRAVQERKQQSNLSGATKLDCNNNNTDSKNSDAMVRSLSSASSTTTSSSGRSSHNGGHQKRLAEAEAEAKALAAAASVNANSNYSNSSDLRTKNNNNNDNNNETTTTTNGLLYESHPSSQASTLSDNRTQADGSISPSSTGSSSSSLLNASAGERASASQAASSRPSPMQMRQERHSKQKQSADRLLNSTSFNGRGGGLLGKPSVGGSTVAPSLAAARFSAVVNINVNANGADAATDTHHVAWPSNLPNSSSSSSTHRQPAHQNNKPIETTQDHINNNTPSLFTRHTVEGPKEVIHIAQEPNSRETTTQNNLNWSAYESSLGAKAAPASGPPPAVHNFQQGPRRASNRMMELNEEQRSQQQQQQQQKNYYYAAAPNQAIDLHHNQHHQQAIYHNSQASSQHTCDEASTSNTDDSTRGYRSRIGAVNSYQMQQQHQSPASSSDYHYYQVVVPENQIASSNKEEFMQNRQPSSPCKSIQRIVSSLFTTNQQQQPDRLPPPPTIPTINQNLVSSEPLIRSSSWQNKTLIDFRLQQQQQQPSQPVHYLESSLIQKTLPCNNNFALNATTTARYTQFRPPTLTPQVPPAIELSNIAAHQQQNYAIPQADHFYCGLATLYRNQSGGGGGGEMLQHQRQIQSPLPPLPPPLAHYKSDGLNHSFHTLTDKMDPRHCYQLQPSMQIANSEQSFGRQPGQETPMVDGAKLKRHSGGFFRLFGLDHFTKFCLIFILMIASGCLLLAAILSPSPPLNPPLLVNNHTLPPSGGVGWPPSPTNTHGGDGQSLPNLPVIVLGPSETTGSHPTTPAPVTVAQTQSTLEASTQRYWLQPPDRQLMENSCIGPFGNECSLKGQCEEGICYCYPGFSGPTCAIANCPNECSRNGECKLRQDLTLNNLGASIGSSQMLDAQFQSIGFQTNQAARSRNSLCPKRSESELNQTWALRGGSLQHQPPSASAAASSSYDNRLEWRCICDLGFMGPDCSQAKELQCDDKLDDDNDGLIDCEDDDCCSQPVCNVNHMCFRSPEPIRALEMWRPSLELEQHQHQQKQPMMPLNYSRDHRFYAQLRFMIGPKSVQSYAKERAFDKGRVSVVRGKVIKWVAPSETNHQTSINQELERGIVSVRVSVAENAEFGFTLTREDGYFDMLVNGDEWITLQFNKNNYAPMKRKIFVRANSFVLLEEGLEMWLTNGAGTGSGANPATNEAMQQTERNSLDPAFNLQLSVDIHKFVAAFQRDDERRRNLLFDCLINGLHQWGANFRVKHEPILLEDPLPGAQGQQLRTFVLASSGAFSTSLDKEAPNTTQQRKPHPVYNSAFFPPSASVVKPTVSIQLLGSQKQQQQDETHSTTLATAAKLKAVLVQLDIEGQSRRERLAPQPRLIYQFAWNRRNVYQQKVYGFGQLNVKIGYEYELKPGGNNRSGFPSLWSECLATTIDGLSSAQTHEMDSPSNAAFDKLKSATFSKATNSNHRVVWFEQKIYLEAHHMNQHSDIGKWTLDKTNRLDQDRELIYFGSGWSLPYKLAYPPTLSEPIPLLGVGASGQGEDEDFTSPSEGPQTTDQTSPVSRLMTKGPNSSMFVVLHPKHAPLSASQLIQLDSTGRRRLLDVPLSILTSKLGLSDQFHGSSAAATANAPSGVTVNSDKHDLIVDDIQILYNNYLSTLYLSSKVAGKMVQVSYASLLVLNKTLSNGAATAAAADDAIDIEPLCGFGRQSLSPNSPAEAIKAARLVRLSAPHSMTLDEERQVLYFIDGTGSLMALDLVSHRLALLPVFGFGRRTSPETDLTNSQQMASSRQCSRQTFRIPLMQYKIHRAHSLTWSRADSSLYFVDQNLVFALRQDLHLELVASGPPPATRTAAAAQLHNLVPTCFPTTTNTASIEQLGLIRSLLADELNGDLLIVHQSVAEQQSGDKISGHLYLAKLKLAATIANTGQWTPAKLIDLHSAKSAWNPMLWRLAENQIRSNLQLNGTIQSAQPDIKWNELASLDGGADSSGQNSAGRPVGVQESSFTKRIPFIHLVGGFKRIDSIEINPFGSIFVLESRTNSIKMVAPYDPNEFNLVERSDVNISRLFASNSLESPSSIATISHTQPSDGSDQQNRKDIELEQRRAAADESRKLNVLIVQNPIFGELMEFHSSSGLQLSLTSMKEGIKSEFYYKILTNNKMVELDEDDKHDFDAQKTVLNYMTSEGNPKNHLILNQVTGAYVRLNKILDSNRNEYELIRLYTGSRFVLQSILLNHQPICEVNTDYSGVLSTYQEPSKNYWIDLIYDRTTYLLRDMIIKIEAGDQSNPQQQACDPASNQFDSTNNNNNSLLGQAATARNWRQLKRIVYDRVFYHYCDLFLHC